MGTKWDPLVNKYKRRHQQELGKLTELNRHLRETEANKNKVSERQQFFRQQLHTKTRFDIDDWRVMKTFLSDLDALRNNCEGQLIEIRELIRQRQEANLRTSQLLQKYELLQQQVLDAQRHDLQRLETNIADEWATQHHSRKNLARELH